MAKSISNGIYADYIIRYVEYKRSLGFKMEDTAERLRRFDQLAQRRGESEVGISKELFEAWSAPQNAESRVNRCGRISILRGFSSFLQLLGYTSYVGPNLPYRSTFSPHIFTSAEMAGIFRECDRLTLSRHYMYSVKNCMPVLVRMLYGTGIRIGEAAKLTNRDVDLDRGLLILRKTKNGQDRLAPMSLSLREVCKDFMAYKENAGIPCNQENFFFMSPDGSKSINPQTVYEIFRAILTRAGIPHEGRSKGPRIHDLRHTFCVNALVKMAESGHDMYHTMPILMTYMGHQSLEATNRYVRLTQEMYPGLLIKVDETYKYVFPDIGGLEEEPCDENN